MGQTDTMSYLIEYCKNKQQLCVIPTQDAEQPEHNHVKISDKLKPRTLPTKLGVIEHHVGSLNISE